MKHENFLIFRLAVPTFLNRLFDYLAPKNSCSVDVKIGVRVLVPFAGTEKVAVLIETDSKTEIESAKLKTAIKILDDKGGLISPFVFG